MKIVRFLGGLGNQMFQHALLLSLREASGESVYADIFDYDRYEQHNGYELERVFGIKNPIATTKQISKYSFFCHNKLLQNIYTKLSFFRYGDIKERHNYKFYPNLINKHRNGYYDGYWQSYLYFEKYKDIIISEFTFKNKLEGKNKQLAEEICNNTGSVSIHIRRGDYLKVPIYAGLCQLDYYKKAINYIKETISINICFYIFSDDVAWCKENLGNILLDSNHRYIDWNNGNDSYIDMQLMSLCKANIIANSSFSWWAAYLNRNADKVVIAPEKWINQNLEFRIQYPGWITIN